MNDEKIAEKVAEEEVTEDVVFEETTRSDYISCSYNAIMAVSDVDTALLPKKEVAEIKELASSNYNTIFA